MFSTLVDRATLRRDAGTAGLVADGQFLILVVVDEHQLDEHRRQRTERQNTEADHHHKNALADIRDGHLGISSFFASITDTAQLHNGFSLHGI